MSSSIGILRLRAIGLRVPQLPRCHAAGKTLEDLYLSLQEAVQLYLEDRDHPDLLLSDRIHAVERYEVDREGLMYPTDLGSEISR